MVELIDEAMEVADGRVVGAAELLRWNPDLLRQRIIDNQALSVKWSPRMKKGLKPPDDRTTLGSSEFAIPKLPSIEEMPLKDGEVAMLMAREQQKLRVGLERMGLNEKEQELALSLQAFHNTQFRSSMEIIGASVTRMSVKYQTLLEATMERLNFVRTKLAEPDIQKGGEARYVWVVEEKNLMADCIAIGDQLRKIMEVAHRGAMMMALIRYRVGKANVEGYQDSPSKPGFRPSIANRPPPESMAIPIKEAS